MKRIYLSIFAICLLLVLGWVLLIHRLNTATAHLTVWVAGAVDEARIVNLADPQTALAVVQTGGQDRQIELDLPRAQTAGFFVQSPAAQYGFIVTADGQSNQDGPVCCSIGLQAEDRRLTIRSLTSWEVQDQ